MKNLTQEGVRFVSAPGVGLSVLLLTTIMLMVGFGVLFACIVTGLGLVVFGIASWFVGSLITLTDHSNT